jgi:hypothetical protein
MRCESETLLYIYILDVKVKPYKLYTLLNYYFISSKIIKEKKKILFHHIISYTNPFLLLVFPIFSHGKHPPFCY